MHRVAVIVLNYNSSEDCRRCVESLKKQEGVELEIVIVDNASAPADKVAVEALCAEYDCTFIAAEENRGYNAGNNIGLRYAADKGYDFALIANPDMLFPQSDYVRTLLETMRKVDDIVVCGSDIVGLDGKHQSPMNRDGNWRQSFGWVKDILNRNNKDTQDYIDNYSRSHYCCKVSGCCLMVRMDFLKSIHYFDEGVFMYCEEAILSRQVEQLGKKMFYTAEVQALHAHRQSDKGDPIRRFKAWKASRHYFIDHYSGDTLMGKWIAKQSMTLYVEVFKIMRRLKHGR